MDYLTEYIHSRGIGNPRDAPITFLILINLILDDQLIGFCTFGNFMQYN